LTNVLAATGEVSSGFARLRMHSTGLLKVTKSGASLPRVGSKSLPLILASGFALGAVLTIHMRTRW
jgi:hypothetical protein